MKEMLEAADPGCQVTNTENGRTVRVRGEHNYRYCCQDIRMGLTTLTDKVSEAIQFLNGEIHKELPEITAELNPFVKPITGMRGGRFV